MKAKTFRLHSVLILSIEGHGRRFGALDSRANGELFSRHVLPMRAPDLWMLSALKVTLEFGAKHP